MTKKERSLVLIKPDALARHLTGHIVNRLSLGGLTIVGSKVVKVNEKLAKEHYKHLSEKPFFGELIDFIQGKLHSAEASGVLAFVYEGDNCVKKIRDIAGATNPELAAPTTLRGQYGRITTKGVMENVIHASSDTSEADREINLWFKKEEIIG